MNDQQLLTEALLALGNEMARLGARCDQVDAAQRDYASELVLIIPDLIPTPKESDHP